ncbi:MAG: Coenzyme F420 hydrogenase/dehydrogenase, beta subunit C-terminal domain [Bacteroidales bacterium]|nr:Coenzyme F420 hydrogenase/dehydrogenase, beta subunit C-terminal domain [Bacteroidales bacterium]
MEWFINKDDCCGCEACVQACPKSCIELVEDKGGFLYPRKDNDVCVDCGICEKVCPVKNNNVERHQPLKTFICRVNSATIIEKCASGGAFYELATITIKQGGVVFGVKFDSNWDACYGYAEDLENMAAFLGSKYVAPRIGDAYKKVMFFLEEGRKVLFSGLPCHVAGLKQYLPKKYENLLTVELMCTAVPGPRVWSRYLHEIAPKGATNVTFRSKSFGWNRYGLKIMHDKECLVHEPNDENLYMQGFLQGLTVRKSCGNCLYKGLNTKGDIMIGDYWELNKYYPELDDNKGMSLVLVFTENGCRAFNAIKSGMFVKEILFSQVDTAAEHSCLNHPIRIHRNRDYFFSKINSNTKTITSIIKKSLYKKTSKPKSLKELGVVIMKSLLNDDYYKFRRLWKRK